VYYQIGAGNLYRVTRHNTIWPDPTRSGAWGPSIYPVGATGITLCTR
jgi:hypothetical protein